MRRLALVGLLLILSGCRSTPPFSAAVETSPRRPSSLDARQAFSFRAQGGRWGSKFDKCIDRDSHDQFTNVSLAQFQVVTDFEGFAVREDYDSVDGVMPCPKLVQREGSLGWNVVTLTRFRREEQTFQCEYKVRGDVYLCTLPMPANYGH